MIGHVLSVKFGSLFLKINMNKTGSVMIFFFLEPHFINNTIVFRKRIFYNFYSAFFFLSWGLFQSSFTSWGQSRCTCLVRLCMVVSINKLTKCESDRKNQGCSVHYNSRNTWDITFVHKERMSDFIGIFFINRVS